MTILSTTMQTVQECKRSGLIDIAILAFSGGTIASLLQILSDAVGAKRMKEEIHRMQAVTEKHLADRDNAFNREEICENTITIIRAKVEMFNRQNSTSCDCLLSQEILRTINQVLPDDKSIIPDLDEKEALS